MRKLRRLRAARGTRALIPGALATWMALALTSGPASAQFQVGLDGAGLQAPWSAAQVNAANAAIDAVHASTVRIAVLWASVGPAGTRAPSGFDAADPADPRYEWAQLDASIRSARQRHLQVILTFID